MQSIKKFKARASALWLIMSSPKWSTPMQKYLEQIEKVAKYEKQWEDTKNKETKTAQKLRDKILHAKDDLVEYEKKKDRVVLSKTCISYLDDRIKENYFGRRKQLKTNAIQKWVECENEAIYILNKALWTTYKKSVYKKWEMMENEWVTGHEDVDGGDHTIDTKVCETFDTFPILKEEIDNWYWRQWQAYMWLKGEKYTKHHIAKVLVNSPAWQVKNKLRMSYNNIAKKYEENPEFVDEEYEHEAREIFLNNVFDKQLTVESNGTTLTLQDDEVIPDKKRVNIQCIERDDEAIATIAKRVQECRQYLHDNWYQQF